MKTTMKNAMLIFITIAASTLTAQTQSINLAESYIKWVGTKIVPDSHEGTLNFSSGSLTFENNVLTAGEFVVDMTSMACTDLEGSSKKKLEKHLKSDDFFGVADHPTATLVINSATKNADGFIVKGDITIKGKTEAIEFDMDMGKDFAATSLNIDRTKFGIKYKSGSFFDSLGDAAISDNFELDVTLKF